MAQKYAANELALVVVELIVDQEHVRIFDVDAVFAEIVHLEHTHSENDEDRKLLHLGMLPEIRGFVSKSGRWSLPVGRYVPTESPSWLKAKRGEMDGMG